MREAQLGELLFNTCSHQDIIEIDLLRMLVPCTSCRVLKILEKQYWKEDSGSSAFCCVYCGVCQLKGLAFLGMYQKGLPNSTVNHLMCGGAGIFISVLMMISHCTSLTCSWTKHFSFTYTLPKYLLILLFLFIFYSQMQTYMINMYPVLRTVLQHTREHLKLIRR